MALTLMPAAVNTAVLETQIAEAKAVAEAAMDRANNARGMVLSRDPVLNDLKATAALFGSTTAGADAIHAELARRIDLIELTPGPVGPAGAQGLRGLSGVDGVQGAAGVAGPQGPAGPAGAASVVPGPAGATGPAGPSGTANLAIGARPIPLLALGGNTSVVVPLSRTLPSTTYRVALAHSAVVDLTKVVLEVTTKTTTSVTVKVTATGLALAAGTLFVVAVA